MTSMQEQFKEQQLVTREAAMEMEIKNQDRVFVLIEFGKMLAWSEFVVAVALHVMPAVRGCSSIT